MTRQEILDKPLWNRYLAKKFLKKPDYTENELQLIENSPEFKVLRVLANKRNDQTVKKAGKIKVKLIQLSKKNLFAIVNKFYEEKHGFVPNENERARVAVNYLRHSCNKAYHNSVGRIRMIDDEDVAYLALFERVIEQIIINYPYLEEECQRQLREKRKR